MLLDVYPDKAFYQPGETVRLNFELTDQTGTDVHVVASIFFLSEVVARLVQSLRLVAGETTTANLIWTPPAIVPRGYGVDLHVLDEAGQTLAMASTAFDVLERWTQSPRYGFLTDFGPDRTDFDQTMLWLTKYHVNGLQFYDWMYRHEQLQPPTEIFDDPLGRKLSLLTVEKLIHAAHTRGIAAIPYTAAYAASMPFFRRHPDWALLDAEGQPIPFGDDFLMIMNPAPGSPWAEHLLDQFAQVLEQMAFDGIHLDQYGDPKAGFDIRGDLVNLTNVFPAFTNVTKEIVRYHRSNSGTVIFNAVGNWPIETVAPSEEDVVYIEVWPPYTRYSDLHQLIVEGQRLGKDKPVVLAAYITPARQYNVRLANAVIFASGGFHIELGELGGMLADPYFPKYGRMSDDLATVLRRYYDFAVRYQNVLSQGTRDTTARVTERVAIEGSGLQITDIEHTWHGVWVIIREGDGFETISLINMLDIAEPEWSRLLVKDPTPLVGLQVRYYTDWPIQRVWWASPDTDNLQAQPLDFNVERNLEGAYVAFEIPSLAYWSLVVLERAHCCQKTSKTE
jgi:dextranase